MEREITRDKVNVRPALYAGRFADQVKESVLTEDCSVLSEWDVMPSQLAAVVDEANVLIILDPLSFPFEALGGGRMDIPLVLLLPTEFEPEVLDGMFGAPVFGRLGFFDRIATGDHELWETLSRKYRWTRCQHIELEAGDPVEAAGEIQERLEQENSTPPSFGEDRYEALRYWKDRGVALAHSAPHRAICSVHHDLGFNKAIHRKQAATLEPQFAAARGWKGG